MRFESTILLKGDTLFKIPVTYRKNFMSLIKESLKPGGDETAIYQKYYGDKKENIQKPFTFSVQIPAEKQENGFFLLREDWLRFYFSSCDPVFLIHVYNGLVGLKKNYPLFQGYGIEVKQFHLQKEVMIDSEDVLFKTCSPFLVRDIEDKRGSGFISCDNENFEKNLFYSAENLCKNFIGKDYVLKPEQFEILPVKCKADIMHHYGGEIGTTGIIKIKAPQEVLQLIYDAGLGAKRSQGFGMMEVIA